MAKEVKTNAMRLLEEQRIAYTAQEYTVEDGQIDGVSVARKVGRQAETVFKTLVTKGHSGACFVFDIPVNQELDLKKAARAAGEKSIALLEVKEITKCTGYVRGGCSPLGMKKSLPTFFDETALLLEEITVSGGRIGTQISLAPGDLLAAAGARTADLVKA